MLITRAVLHITILCTGASILGRGLLLEGFAIPLRTSPHTAMSAGIVVEDPLLNGGFHAQ